jgi:hypothetical protein
MGLVATIVGVIVALARPEVVEAVRVVLRAFGPKGVQLAGVIVSVLGAIAQIVAWVAHLPRGGSSASGAEGQGSPQ